MRSALLALTLLAAPLADMAGQQRQRCTIDSRGPQRNVQLPSGEYNSFMGGGVTARCPANNQTLRADSLESYGDEGRIFFVGNVHYVEPRLELDSDRLTLFQRDERVLAQGNVFAKLPSGHTVRGPYVEYFRVIPGTRPVARLHATGRPTIMLVQKDSIGQPTPPTTVVGNVVTMVGDSLVYAAGAVQIDREDISARADSMHLDSQREFAVLMRAPSISGKGARPFTLSGERLELTSKNRKLERVLSKGRAKALSREVTLTSDTLDLRIANDLLQRAFAWGPTRALATSSTQQIVADSMDVMMPDQRMRQLFAVGRARAEAKTDSVRFRADTTDWMEGNTIIARFDSTPPRAASRDSAPPPELRQLVAVGNARSFQHLPPADSSLRVPAINYVIGREIVVDFEEQRVSRVTVIQKAMGLYAEPRREPARPDSAGVRRAPAPGAVPARPTPSQLPGPPVRRPQ